MPEAGEEEVRGVLEKLVPPPLYHLPPATQGHKRHYMPWDKNWNQKRHAAKTMVMDNFVCVPKDEPIVAYWPDQSLATNQKELLRQLLDNLPYLGRAESICEAKLVEEVPDIGRDNELFDPKGGQSLAEARPLNGGDVLTDEEMVEVLVPQEDIDMSSPLNEDHPLLVRTNELKDEGRVHPSGARWINYVRPKDSFEPQYGEPDREMGPNMRVIRYRLDGKVLPSVKETLYVGDKARAAAMSVYGGPEKKRSSVLSGKDEKGNMLKGHNHAFYLPTDEDGDGKLDHMTIYAPMGLDEEHQEALGGLTYLRRKRSYDLDTLLLGMAETREAWVGEVDLFGKFKCWKSITPYMLTRHPKKKSSGEWRTEPFPEGLGVEIPDELGHFPTMHHLLLEYGVTPGMDEVQKDGPLSQLLLSLERRGYPKPEVVEPIPEYRSDKGVSHRWLEFKRHRKYGLKPAVGTPYGFKITFGEAVEGPVTLGYGSHFGLGLFEPIRR